MNGYLRQSTAGQVRTIGPFVDDTDFKSVENALTIANTDVKLKKNGAASGNKNSGGATADGTAGLYHLTWDATDTSTVGELHFAVLVAGALIVWGTYVVLEEAVYDALFGASAPGYLQPTTAGRTLDVSAGGEAGIDWANIGSPTTVQGLSGTTVKTATDVETDTADIQSRLPAALVSGRMSSDMVAVSGDTAAADNLENAFDETAGPVPWLGIVDQGTAQSATATTVVLRSAAAFGDNTLIGAIIAVLGSTQGYWQTRVITDNVGSTDTATVDTWDVTPSGTITYKIFASAPASAAETGAIADAVWEEPIADHEGTVGSTAEALATAGGSGASAADIADAVCDELLSGHTTAGTVGKALSDIDTHTDTETSAAAIRAAVGLASPNLDTQLTTIDDFLDTEIADIRARLPAALTANGNLKVSLQEILATALTEASSGQLAAAFKKWFDVASPVGTVNSIPDATAGASGGIAIVGSAMTLAANAVDAATLTPAADNEIADALLDRTSAVESGVTVRQVLRLIAAVLGGKSSGLDTGNPVFRNLGDSKNVVTATADADGNRTSVTTDLT
jgi:hypothetical protein